MKSGLRYSFLAGLTFLLFNNSVAQPITYDWARGMGGRTTSEGIVDITRDSQGNTYVTGDFAGTKAFGNYTLFATGFSEVFVAKYDPSGTCLWAVKGGANFSSAYTGGVAISGGELFVTGYFTNNINFGNGNVPSAGLNDIFVAKLNTNDGSPVWVNAYGGLYFNEAFAISPHNAGGVIIAGKFSEITDFGSGVTINSGSFSNIDLFLAKINSSGTAAWAFKGGHVTKEDRAYDVVQLPSGGIVLTGFIEPPAQFGNITATGVLNQDFFLAKFSASGTPVFVETSGSDGGDWGSGLGYDASGNIYVSGFIGDTAYFGSYMLPDNGYGNIFTAKYTNSGQILWAKHAGGNSNDSATDLVTDDGGSSYVTGYVTGSALFSGTWLTGVQLKDAFICKYGPSGTLRWVTRIGGAGFDTGKSIALDKDGDFITAGDYFGNVVLGSSTLSSASGDYAVYLTKMGGGTVGIDENKDLVLSIYPNPAAENINIVLPSFNDAVVSVDVIDMDGRIIRSEQIGLNIIQNTISLDINELVSGSYILRMDTSDGYYTGRFVK